VIVGACQHVGEPGLQVDTIEPRRRDQRIHHRGPLAATVGAGEQLRFAAERDGTQLAFGAIARQANPPVL
jgi:hypothetical protein